MDLVVQIIDESADGEQLEASARGLRRDLQEIDDLEIRQLDGDSAPGAKGDVTLLGTIAISMVSSAIPALVTILGRWIQDRNRCTVRVTRADGTSLEIPHQLDRTQIEKIVASLLTE